MRVSRRLAGLFVGLLPLLAAGSLVGGCGEVEPRFRQRTAADWAADMWSVSPTEVGRAAESLRQLARTHPVLVADALSKELVRPRPPAAATPFSVKLDVELATRLGLDPMHATSALEADLGILRRRLLGAGLPLLSLHGDSLGNVDVIFAGARSRAEAEHIQRFACRRGALDLRPTLPVPDGAGPDASDFAAWFDAERARFAEARAAGTAYRPSRADRSVAPLAPDVTEVKGSGADRMLALEEPTIPVDVFDERVVEAARGFVGEDGKARVRIVVFPGRRNELAAWTTTLRGRHVAVRRDGVVTEIIAVSRAWRDGFEVKAVGELGEPADPARLAREDAAALEAGRTPRPLMPIPIAAAFAADPPPDNPVSRLMLELGEISAAALAKVANDVGAPAWSKKSAAWALSEYRAYEAQRPK